MTTSLLTQVLRKTSVFEFETLRIRQGFDPCRIRLLKKNCAEMKEEAQVHYFRTILAIPIPV